MLHNTMLYLLTPGCVNIRNKVYFQSHMTWLVRPELQISGFLTYLINIHDLKLDLRANYSNGLYLITYLHFLNMKGWFDI